MSKNVKPHNVRRSIEGFSLVELLVVIAVIAILAAIIFPVFSSAQEKARQGTVMSNYSRVSKALAQYELDNGNHSPKVLFAYGVAGQSMDSVKSTFHTANPPGLYPNYINDPTVFTDPDNPVSDTSALTGALPVNVTDATGTMTASTATFYQADAMDVSPLITSATAIDKNTLVPRYQADWTTISADPTSPPGGLSTTVYGRQVAFWQNAPGETYVTATTYHVGKGGNKVLVLFKSGVAKAMDTSIFLSKGGDTPDISVNGSGISKANFWQLTPNG